MSNQKLRRILVVDDDDLLRDFYCKVISNENFEPVPAEDGDSAIKLLKENPDFALAIIDLLMPIRTGWELIQHMKKDDKYKDIPIMTLTGLADSFNKFKVVEDMSDIVLHKGKFELPEFVEAIKKLTTC